MPNFDFALYVVHSAFWGAFGLTRLILRARDRKEAVDTAPVSQQEHTAPHSRLLVVFHMIAFFVMYVGVGNAVIPGLVPDRFAGQRAVGALVIAGWSCVDGVGAGVFSFVAFPRKA